MLKQTRANRSWIARQRDRMSAMIGRAATRDWRWWERLLDLLPTGS